MDWISNNQEKWIRIPGIVQLRIKRQDFVGQARLTEEFVIKKSYTGQSGRPA